jgi:hypothetical protein
MAVVAVVVLLTTAVATMWLTQLILRTVDVLYQPTVKGWIKDNKPKMTLQTEVSSDDPSVDELQRELSRVTKGWVRVAASSWHGSTDAARASKNFDEDLAGLPIKHSQMNSEMMMMDDTAEYDKFCVGDGTSCQAPNLRQRLSFLQIELMIADKERRKKGN